MIKRVYISTERADLFDVNMMIAMSIDVKGNIDDEQVVRAFHRAVDAQEIFTMHIVIDEFGNAYYEPYDSQNNTLTFLDKDIREIIIEQEKIRFRIEEGEFLRVYARRTSKGLTFIFLMHHLAGDGKSLCYFIESFMTAMAGLELKYMKMKRLDVDDLPPKSKMPFFYKKYVKHFNRMWKKEKRIFTFLDMDESFNQFWSKHKTVIETRIIDEAELLSMKSMCHDNRIGLTSLLIADYLKNTVGKQDIGLAVDGRLDGNRCMGNQATGISIKYKYHRKISLLDNAMKIDKAIKNRLSDLRFKYFILHFMAAFDSSLIDAVNLQYSGAYTSKTSKKLASILGYGKNTKDLSVSNLTVLDIPEKYGELYIDNVSFVPPVISYGKNVIGIATVNNKMIISRHYYADNNTV